MEESIDRKAQKQKHKSVSYNVLFMPDDDTMAVKTFSIKMEVLVLFFAAAAFLIVTALTYCFILARELGNANDSILALRVQSEKIIEENSQLASKNEKLQEKVDILSDTINDKIIQEERREAEQAQSCMPSGFPLKGTASYNSDETELDGQPIAYFHVVQGTGVIATANGTVSSVSGSSGSGYIVMVDHGNGYYSVYRNGSQPKVSEGDEVTKATELFVIEAGHERLGYQIIEENQYINPLEFMETYG